MNEIACPSEEVLSAFQIGRLGPVELAEVASHVESCELCQGRLSCLSDSNDDLLQDIRRDLAGQHSEGALGTTTGGASAMANGQGNDLAHAQHLGQYRLLELLGAGGMGAVYKAEHVKLRKLVAVKVLPAERMRDAATIARFHREMEAVGKLDNPYIVRATDAGEVDGMHFLVMEFVPGVDLARLVRQYGPLPICNACDVARQAALGLAHAHRHGLVHRDVKPSNLLATPQGGVKILDLGLARLQESPSHVGELTFDDHVLGTADYMAPEQWDAAHSVDIRADIYSLGCTLYQLLTGRPPFGAAEFNTLFRKMAAHRDMPPPNLTNVRREIPPEVAAIVERMLAKDPNQRHQSPEEVANALEPWGQGSTLDRAVSKCLESAQGNAGFANQSQTKTPVHLASALTDTHRPNEPSENPAAVAEVTAQAATARRRRFVRNGLFSALLLSLIVGGVYLFRIEAAKGTVEFDSIDKDISIELSGPDGATVVDLRTRSEIRIREGEYEARIVDGSNSLRIENGVVTLRRGDRVVVRILNHPPDAELATERVPAKPLDQVEPLNALGDWRAAADDTSVLRGIIPRPAKLPGVTGRWNIETVFPRGVVRSVAFSQDDRWLACASEDGNVRIFNTEDARLLHLLQVSEHGVTSVAWQPNGNRLATISSRGDVKVWDEQGRVVASRSPDVPTIVADLTWNPDGTRLAFSVGNGKLAVLSADLKGEPLLTIKHRHDFDQLAWSSDGQWIATSFQNDASDVGSNAEDDRNVICLWNASDGSAGPKLVGHNGSITDLAWKGDSASLASSSLDGTVRIWTIDGSAPKGEVTPTETLEHDGAPVLAVAWSSDDALLATGTNGRGQDQVMVRTWDSSRWREEHRLSKFPQAVSSLTWSHKGRRLATGTGVAGKAFNTFWGGAGYSVNMFQFSGAMPAKMWPWVVLHGILDITWNCDSTRLASVRGTGTSDPFLCRWNARLGRFDGVIQVSASRPNAASYSPSPASKGIAIGGGRSDHSVRLWDTDRRQPGVVFEGHPGGIRALSWHPKGTEIASAGAMSEVRRWSTASGELLGQPFDMKCAAVVYSPGGGRLAVAGSDGIQVLDLATQKTTPLPNTATASVNALAWSPTGLQIASCSDRPNSSVTVWPLNTVNRPLVFQYDFCDLFDVAWEPNGNRLAAAADDGSVVIFHTKSPGESKTLPGHVAALNAVAWSPDGTMLASSGRDAMIHVWNAQTLEPLWVGIMLPGTDSNGSLVTFSAAGEVLSGFEKPFNHLVYLHEHADGQLELLSQADFMDRVDKSAATAAEQSGDEP